MWTVAFVDHFHMCSIWHTMRSHARDAGAKHAEFMFWVYHQKVRISLRYSWKQGFLKMKKWRRENMSILTTHLKMPEKDDHVTSQVRWECESRCKLYLLTFILYIVYLKGLMRSHFFPDSSIKMMIQWNVFLLHKIMSLDNFVGSHFVSLIHFFFFFLSICVFLNISTSNLLMYKLL